MAGNFLEITEVGNVDTRFGLLVTSKEIGAEALLIVAEGAEEARKNLEKHSPHGQTGNLKRAWLASLPTPSRGPAGRFVAGEGFEARAHIARPTFPTPMVQSLHYGNKDIRNEPVDPPWKYALAVSEGRRELSALTDRRPGHTGRFFMWQRGRPRPVFIQYLNHRPGNHFISIAQEETSVWASERTRSFAQRISRSTEGSRAIRRSDLGFPGT